MISNDLKPPGHNHASHGTAISTSKTRSSGDFQNVLAPKPLGPATFLWAESKSEWSWTSRQLTSCVSHSVCFPIHFFKLQNTCFAVRHPISNMYSRKPDLVTLFTVYQVTVGSNGEKTSGFSATIPGVAHFEDPLHFGKTEAIVFRSWSFNRKKLLTMTCCGCASYSATALWPPSSSPDPHWKEYIYILYTYSSSSYSI